MKSINPKVYNKAGRTDFACMGACSSFFVSISISGSEHLLQIWESSRNIRLLTDRFVGACAYAAETAFSNGASDSDVLSWLTDSLKGFDCHGALENGCCRSENRRFLRLWLGCSGMIPLYIRFGLYIRSIGRTIKYWISRRGTR